MIRIINGERDADLELLREDCSPDFWIQKLVEEMAELTAAIQHVMLEEKHRDPDAMRDELIGEFSDVLVCVDHVYETLPLSLKTLVWERMNQKIDRALMRRELK